MVIKQFNIIAFVIIGLILYLLHIEYDITLTKPIVILIGFVITRLWLRTVSTATYILFHVVLFGGCYLWVKHFLNSVSTFDLVAMATQLLEK